MEQEIWLPIKYGNGKKEISSTGLVRNAFTKKILKQYIRKDGYPCISFWVDGFNRSFKIHRLVAETFLPIVNNKTHVNHIDFNKINNNISNLEWCTLHENIQHYYKEKFNHIITDEIVKFIRENIDIIKPRKLAKQLNLSEGYIYGVANGIHCPNIYPELIREKRTSAPKIVIKYDKSGNRLKEYNSIYEAAKDNNAKLSYIQRVLSGERDSWHGLIFKCEGYKKVEGTNRQQRLIHLRKITKERKLKNTNKVL